MTTAFYSHAECRAHEMGRGHPECPQRLAAIDDHLLATGLDIALERCDAPLVDLADVAHAHASGYVSELRELLEPLQAGDGVLAIDPDTAANAGTWRAVQRAAGAAVAATDAVLDGRADNAFCSVRPPGHHATRNAAMGFCFFNNVAIAARHALDVRGLQRVAIVDFDVHHGNGTEDIIAGDERVLMVSLFQHPLYPYSGAVPKGTNMVNVPLPAYTRGGEVREIVEAMWLPALERFKPQMIFISAGFDAHRDDDMAGLNFEVDDYAWVTRELVKLADRHCKGRIVSSLEGGYNLRALAKSAAAHVDELLRG